VIRKWSYININIPNLLNSVIFFKNKYKFKVFRKTTKFRRFQVGKTKGLRKLPIVLNRRTDKLNISNITHKWLYFYLKAKQFIRFQQNLFTTTYLIHSTSKNLFIKNFFFVNLNQNQGYNFITCTRQTPLLLQKNKHTKYTSKFIQTNLLNLTKNTPLSNSNLLFYEKLYYPIDVLAKLRNNNQIIPKLIVNKLFRCNLQIPISIRKLSILLILLNL
jgi:hypothetical protein